MENTVPIVGDITTQKTQLRPLLRDVCFFFLFISCKFTIYSTNGAISKYEVRKVTCAE
jgi:hypothetical protein